MEEMKRLIGLDQPREHTTSRSEEDDEDVEEDDDEPLLHSNVLDDESQEMVRVLRAQSTLAEEDGQHFSVERMKVSIPGSLSSDVVRVNQKGRWFSAVAELHQEEGEVIGDLMMRHFSVLEGKLPLKSSGQLLLW